MPDTNEAFSRAKIDGLLKDVGWTLKDGRSVRFEVPLSDGTRADYALCDRHGRALAVIEAKRGTINPVEAAAQARAYAVQLDVPFVFLSNGDEVWFWHHTAEAHPHQVSTFFAQEDLERRFATLATRVDPLTVTIDRKIVERGYQLDCIETLCKEMGLGRRKLLVEMATGTGKTRTAAAFIKRLFQANAVTRVLFLVDRISLAKQTEDAFTEHLPDYPSYVLTAGRFRDEKRITITTLQSMVNVYREYSSGYFDLIISDECHRSIYGKWSGVLKHFDGVQVGLTATPCVVPPDVLERLEDEDDKAFVRDTLRFFEVDKPTFRYTLKEAVAQGYLVPYQIYRALTVRTAAAEGGFEVKRSELDWSAMSGQIRQEFEELFGDKDTIVVDPSALERTFTIPERNRAIVREFRDVLEKGYTGKDGVRRFPADGKTIVFAVTKRHAATLAQMFDQAFADRKPAPNVPYADFVVSGMGDDDTADGMTKVKRFKKEPFPKILVSVNMLDTGFDCPEVVNLVMARFTKSAILYQQMRGRGTRRADHIKKVNFTIFDFVGVTVFHGDDEDIVEGGFVIPKTPKDQPKKPRSLLVLDIHDQIDPTTRGWVTLDADGNEIRTEAGEARANELGLRFEAWLLDHPEFNSDQLRLLQMIGEQIRANATVWESFEAYHFVSPPFSNNGGLDRALQVFGGEDKLSAMLASMNASVFAEPASDESGEHPPPPGQ